MHRIACIITSLILLSSLQVYSRSFFVSSINGDNSRNGLSAENAWADLSNVHWGSFLPGDSIKFECGSTFEGSCFIVSAGSSSQPIVFTSYGQGVLPQFRNSGEWSNCLEVRGDQNAAYIIIEKLHLAGSEEAGVNIRHGAHHVIIQDCEISNTGFGVYLGGPYNLVTRNNIHDLKMIRNTLGTSSPENDDDYGACAVVINESHNTVSNNTMLNCRAPSYDYQHDGGAVEFFGNVDSCTVAYNYASGCDGFLEVGGGDMTGNRIHHNMAFNNWNGFAYIHLTGLYGAQISDMRIENNTIVCLKQDKSYALVLGIGGTASDSMLFFRNNVVYARMNFTNSSSFNRSHNIFSMVEGASIGTSLKEGEITSDPLFADLAGGDPHLTSASPAIDAGMDCGYTYDFDGNPPSGQIDIGAFEFRPTGTPLQKQKVKVEGIRSKIHKECLLVSGVSFLSKLDAVVTDLSGKILFRGPMIQSNGKWITPRFQTTPNTILLYRLSGPDFISHGRAFNGKK